MIKKVNVNPSLKELRGYQIRKNRLGSGFIITMGKKKKIKGSFSSQSECEKIIHGILEKKYSYRRYWLNKKSICERIE